MYIKQTNMTEDKEIKRRIETMEMLMIEQSNTIRGEHWFHSDIYEGLHWL